MYLNIDVRLKMNEILSLKPCSNVKKISLSDHGVFPKWNRNSLDPANSGNLINHLSMNLGQFRDPISHICLAATEVASWSLTQEVAEWQV